MKALTNRLQQLEVQTTTAELPCLATATLETDKTVLYRHKETEKAFPNMETFNTWIDKAYTIRPDVLIIEIVNSRSEGSE